jgi:8-oxo-dGTP pyrophosphatase MutT (NUDIX family)
MALPEDPERPAPQQDQPAKRTRRRRRRRRKPAGAQAAQPQRSQQRNAAREPARASGTKRRRKRPAREPAATKGSSSGKDPSAKAPARAGAKRKSAKRKGAKRARSSRRPQIPTTREVSAGGVLYRSGDDGIEVVLASRRTRRGQLAWGLAKGGIEEGESKEEAAVREVREETGLTADIEADLGDTKYMYVWDDIRIRKTVHFFLMRHTGGDVADRDDEMEEIRWFPLERAIKRAAYRGERDMLVKASELLR